MFFTSDTHLADPRVLRIDRRLCPNMTEHDEALMVAEEDGSVFRMTAGKVGTTVLSLAGFPGCGNSKNRTEVTNRTDRPQQ